LLNEVVEVFADVGLADQRFSNALRQQGRVFGIECGRRAASYVDRILRGGKPGDLPVQFPTKYEMAVNLKTAKALGLAVPPSILLRADEQIE
jgi:hypothetical protein